MLTLISTGTVLNVVSGEKMMVSISWTRRLSSWFSRAMLMASCGVLYCAACAGEHKGRVRRTERPFKLNNKLGSSKQRHT